MKHTSLWMLVSLGTIAASAQPSFDRDIRPILQKQCQGCHNPAGASSDLDVTTYAAFAKGGKRGPGFVTGKPDASLTMSYILGDVKPRMPMGQAALPAADIDRISAWIAAGGSRVVHREFLRRQALLVVQ